MWILDADNPDYSTHFSTHFKRRDLMVEIMTDEVCEMDDYVHAQCNFCSCKPAWKEVWMPVLRGPEHSQAVRLWLFLG